MNCPNCGNRGKKVKRITLDSLLKSDAKSRITDAVYYFCDSPNCDLVYFAEDGSTFAKDDLTVRVGVKTPPGTGPRHVCYCFDHTIEEIEAEVNATGTSTVLDDIKTRMKSGCWCEKTSPAGGCCLGTVAKYINAAVDEFGPSSGIGVESQAGRVEEDHVDCGDGACGAEGSATAGSRSRKYV